MVSIEEPVDQWPLAERFRWTTHFWQYCNRAFDCGDIIVPRRACLTLSIYCRRIEDHIDTAGTTARKEFNRNVVGGDGVRCGNVSIGHRESP